ncbi:SAUR-like auxin-responsive protein family [Striga hermonthica]|uniref:SAUR-like auxin-responsive protein family n=1 Tax=Striga hermonthica TaxID=68872 RepID=A0A9N7RNT0_STRHE|nr:SAUR-like auxin-responsive protein family [Striga hermonthica]
MMHEEKKMKVKKGWVAVQVGLEDDYEDHARFHRFSIPISYLYHPLFHNLLDKAREIYGYNTSGPLVLPCSVDDFLHLRWRIERETARSGGGGQHHHRHLFPAAASFSFHSC